VEADFAAGAKRLIAKGFRQARKGCELPGTKIKTPGSTGGFVTLEREKGFEPAEAAHANRATGHANPHNSPEPQQFPEPSFSAPVRIRLRQSPDSVEAAWRRPSFERALLRRMAGT